MNENLWILIKISLKFFLWGRINIFSTGSDYGLAPSGLQAIIWTNGGLFADVYMRHSVLCVNITILDFLLHPYFTHEITVNIMTYSKWNG